MPSGIVHPNDLVKKGEARAGYGPVGAVGTPSRPPKWIKPQVTRLVDEAPAGGGRRHEIKYDGYRMHAPIDRGQVKLLTRTGLDWSHTGKSRDGSGHPEGEPGLDEPLGPRKGVRERRAFEVRGGDDGPGVPCTMASHVLPIRTMSMRWPRFVG